MARSNPDKRPRREAQKTLLIVCEGETEAAFVRYLKEQYNTRGCGVQVKIIVKNEGSPEAIIKATRRWLKGRAYNQCLIIMDTDLPWPVNRPRKSKNTEILYFQSSPCIEGFILGIINHPNQYLTWNTNQCKKDFHKLLTEDDKLDHRKYIDILPLRLLEAKRTNIGKLHRLIMLLEGKAITGDC